MSLAAKSEEQQGAPAAAEPRAEESFRKLRLVLPKTAAGAADRMWDVRERRLALQRQADGLADEESALRGWLLEKLTDEQTGAAGRRARAQVVPKQVPRVSDWDALYRTIKRTGEFELLQRRVNEGAVRERWEAGKQVAGVEPFKVRTISLTKV